MDPDSGADGGSPRGFAIGERPKTAEVLVLPPSECPFRGLQYHWSSVR